LHRAGLGLVRDAERFQRDRETDLMRSGCSLVRRAGLKSARHRQARLREQGLCGGFVDGARIPLPLVGRGQGWGYLGSLAATTPTRAHFVVATSPQGGGERLAPTLPDKRRSRRRVQSLGDTEDRHYPPPQ